MAQAARTTGTAPRSDTPRPPRPGKHADFSASAVDTARWGLRDVSLCVQFISCGAMSSVSTHVASCTVVFNRMMFRCVYVSRVLYPLISQWTVQWFPRLGRCQQGCRCHFETLISVPLAADRVGSLGVRWVHV